MNADQQQWVAAARAALDETFGDDLVLGMTSIASPTGDEAELARWLTDRMASRGLSAAYQEIDARQGNATARLRGDGTGEDLLLYAPIDTLTVGTEEADVPWIGPALDAGMRPAAVRDGDFVTGLGAGNPKGHGAALILAADAIRAAGVPLKGDLLLALCAGGMPANRRPGGPARANTGQGNGGAFFLEQGGWADHALICKPGWAVHWEEVGLCWFEVRVRGTYHYVGSRHRMPYVNPVVAAAPLIAGLDRWFGEYAERWTDGLVAPQGNIGSIRSGWPHLLSLSPAVCEIRFDLRTSPRAPLPVVRREVDAILRRLTAEHGLDADWDMVLSIPGTYTDPDAWIVRAAIASWEEAEGRPHEPITANSGATDANILRAHGLPTARIGMPRVGDDAPGTPGFARGMNTVDLREVRRLARTLIHTAVLTCTRDR